MRGEIIVQARLQANGIVVQILTDDSEVILENQTDWDRVDTMTDEEIEAAALSDPDCPSSQAGQFQRESLQEVRVFSGKG